MAKIYQKKENLKEAFDVFPFKFSFLNLMNFDLRTQIFSSEKSHYFSGIKLCKHSFVQNRCFNKKFRGNVYFFSQKASNKSFTKLVTKH